MDYSLEEEAIDRLFARIKASILPSEQNNYKSRFLQSNFLLYCVVLLLILKITATLVFFNIPQNVFFADITKSALENSINQTRQSSGLQPLAENQKLAQAAQLKAENMVQNQYFDHTSPSGITPWFWFSKVGYNYKYAGENLAIGFYESEEVYNAWLNSPSHKANIVNPNYTEIGTAVLSGFGPNNSIVVVQEFGSQMPAKQAAAPKNTAPKPAAAVQPKPNPVAKTPKPAPKPAQTATVPASEKVLSQTTQSQSILESPAGNAADNLPSRVLNSVLYDYDALLQNIVYALSLIIIGILLSLIFFSFKINFRRELVLRSALIIILLSIATALNKETIMHLIPHQIII